MWTTSFVQLFLFHFQPVIAISRHLQTRQRENCEKANAGEEVLAKPIQKESAGKEVGLLSHWDTLYVWLKQELPLLSAASPPPTHLTPSISSTSSSSSSISSTTNPPPSICFNVEYIYAICQSASTSVPQSFSLRCISLIW